MSAPERRWQEMRVALMLLTRLPAGRLSDPVPTLADARWAYPFIGLPVGLIGWAVHAGLLALGTAPVIAALLTFTVLVLVTGALHQDGLADFADGIGGGRDRVHCLEIMRDSRIGSYGVLALGLTSGLWIAALTQMAAAATLPLFLVTACSSRLGMVLLLDSLPAARSDGLGASAMAQGAAWRSGAALCTVLLVLAGWSGLSVFAACLVCTTACGWLARRRIGGQTGDVLGATQFLSATASWTTLAIVLL